jgi:SAM-dependent methyltransferase
MLREESIWLRSVLTPLAEAGRVSSVLDVGSSTGRFRAVDQPYIDANVFAPLRARGIRIWHLDAKVGDGVDIVCSVEQLPRLSDRYDLVLACNVLEHVRHPDRVARDLRALVSPGGYLVVTVPSQYPYHEDPIDTMFRPTDMDLVRMLEPCRVLESRILPIREPLLGPRIAGLIALVRRRGLAGVRLARLFSPVRVACAVVQPL